MSGPVQRHRLDLFRLVLMAGTAAILLSGCALNRATAPSPDFSGLPAAQAQQSLGELGARHAKNPRDKNLIISYAAALRAAGNSDEASTVLEAGMQLYGRDGDMQIAYAKALTAQGRFDQALGVLDNAIVPGHPDWNALSVKGCVLDQMGRNAEARQYYNQALLLAPNEASLEANLGLSFAMTNELDQAEAHLRKAVTMAGVTSQIRQNLALVFGLQGRFTDSRALYAAELPPDQVEANMAYIRALLTQQNRWDAIQGEQ